MKVLLYTLSLSLFIIANSFAQNPWKKYGYEPKPALTLSNGEYQEFFTNDTIVQIGSVLFNTVTNNVIGFIKQDTISSEATLKLEVVSRWLSPDPLMTKYAPISPYVFALNNPIIFMDGDGRVVIGSDGNPVTYENKDGQIHWSSNATDDIKTIGGAMLKTTTGEQAFQDLQNSPTKVSLILSSKNSEDGYGVTKGKGQIKKDGKIYYETATITISQGAIDEKESRFGSTEEGLNAVGVHERWHLEPEQILKDKKEPNSFKSEENTIKKEYDARIDYNTKYNNGDTKWQDAYKEDPNVKDDYDNPKPDFRTNAQENK